MDPFLQGLSLSLRGAKHFGLPWSTARCQFRRAARFSGEPRAGFWGRSGMGSAGNVVVFSGKIEPWNKSMDWFKGKSTGNQGFYHQIVRGFRLKFSRHPILWTKESKVFQLVYMNDHGISTHISQHRMAKFIDIWRVSPFGNRSGWEHPPTHKPLTTIRKQCLVLTFTIHYLARG